MEKMTNVKALNYVIANVELPEEVMEKVVAMRDGYVKKAENKKPTKAQAENEGIKVAIVEALAETEGMTATAVGNAVGVTVHRATALLKQLVTEGKVERVADKKTVTFKAVEQ